MFEVSSRRDSQRSAHSAMRGYGAGAGDGTHGPPHTGQLRRMVATADRSPARYTFELKLAEVPSGPLNSELELLAATRPHIECDRAGGGPVSYDCRRGFLRSRLVPACLRSRTTRMAVAFLALRLAVLLRRRRNDRIQRHDRPFRSRVQRPR